MFLVKWHLIHLKLKGPGTELSRRVHNLLSITRMRANSGDFRDSIHILGPAKLQEQSLCDLQEVWFVVTLYMVVLFNNFLLFFC